MEFKNEERNRYYGLRVGDIVTVPMFVGRKKAEVIGLHAGDNNGVQVHMEDGTERKEVAEWCDIITKVEDRERMPSPFEKNFVEQSNHFKNSCDENE